MAPEGKVMHWQYSLVETIYSGPTEDIYSYITAIEMLFNYIYYIAIDSVQLIRATVQESWGSHCKWQNKRLPKAPQLFSFLPRSYTIAIGRSSNVLAINRFCRPRLDSDRSPS